MHSIYSKYFQDNFVVDFPSFAIILVKYKKMITLCKQEIENGK